MFVIIYQGNFDPVKLVRGKGALTAVGQWRVDTEPDGRVATIEDLTEALERVKYIRDKGGEACLTVVIE